MADPLARAARRRRRRRSRVVALAIVAAAGLPIQDRYVFLIAAILLRSSRGAGLFGWRTLAPGTRAGGSWQGAAS